MGTSTTADGHSIGINNLYLTKDGKPWIPVMGEIHYTRLPPEEWEDEIIKMKSAGVNVIASYVIWIHHEPQPGQFNWSGDRNLRQFVELCAKHDMKVVLRLGPWAHGEVRYGGIPEWVVNQMPSRRNDPTYLTYVGRYWKEIAGQVHGLYFKDGGPIIGIQLENEYNLVGDGMGPEHISTLKALAQSLGMDVPLYTVTGWDGTTYPKGEVTPVFGGYLDEPWGLGITKMGPNEVYNFRFNSRVAGNAGAQTPGVTIGTAFEDIPHTPFLGAEYAGGLPIMYRRRPLVSSDDVGAMIPVQLGSGVNLYGYYMFHGGRNPGLNLEENALVGGYNDVPEINYDFQAPFGQYGQPGPALDTIRPYHLFLNAFGDRLAPMTVHAPEKEPAGREDQVTPRYSVRSNGNSGFLFMNNYVRQYPMTVQKDIQFSVNLPSGPLVFPAKPITVPAGAYFIWPINFDMDGINLSWATVQPVTRIETEPGQVTYVFVAEEGIAPELAFSDPAELKIDGAAVAKADGLSVIRPKPSTAIAVKVRKGDMTISIVVLTHSQASQLRQGTVFGKDRLVFSPDEVMIDTNTLELHSIGDNRFKVGFYPALKQAPSGGKLSPAAGQGIFQTFTGEVPAKTIPVTLSRVRPAGKVPPIHIGGAANRAIQPYPEAFGAAGAWSISIPASALQDIDNAYLQIDYQGDVARLFSGTTLLDDQFFYGPTWQIGLKRFEADLSQPLTLTVLPLPKDAPVYLDDTVRAALPVSDQIADVKAVRVVPQYSLRVSN